MSLNSNHEIIHFWRPQGFAQLELRRGFSVARPVPSHWHEEYQLCFIQFGESELKYRGSSLSNPPASLFIVHPGEIHSNRCFNILGCTYRTMFIDTELMSCTATEIFEKKQALPFFPEAIIFDEHIIRLYLDLHIAFEQHSSLLERQTRLLNFISTLILRFAENRSSPSYSFSLERQAVNRAYEYLVENYADNVSLEKLASLANLSPFHFNRVFSKQIGMPPHAFQTQLRVLQAKALLRQGRSISQVAAETGFADQSHLTRQFKKLVVVTPGQYIQNSKNVQDRSAQSR